MQTATEIVLFWQQTVGPENWYRVDANLDAQIRARYLDVWQQIRDNSTCPWAVDANGALAYLLVTDQFPRNMFRGMAQAFATDEQARQMARTAIAENLDQQIAVPLRQFFFLPLMHAESLVDQDLSVQYFATRMDDPQANQIHTQAHRQVIAQFGRFPYRNDALGRVSTPAELEYLAQGGYGATLKALAQP